MIIVKYSNRKLYNKETAKYTSIVELLRLPLGSFKVERHGTGEDVTTDTLLTSLTSENLTPAAKVEVMKHCIATFEGNV